MAFARLTGCRGGTGKRPASVACETSGDRDRKRAKDCAHNGQVAAPTVTAPAASVAKRPFNDYEESAMQDTTMGGHAAVTIELGDGEDRGNRVLQSSDLENSVAIISGALRWRSPVKPYKMPRLQGPRLPTAVHSIVNVGPDTDHDDGNYPGQQLAHQQRRPAGCNGCTPQAQQLQVQQGPGPAKMQPHSTQPEWGRLFSALSLGGPARGSQRTDPVWAAATSNRTGGGGRGIGGFDRSVVNSKPGLHTLFRPLPGAPSPRPTRPRPSYCAIAPAWNAWTRQPAGCDSPPGPAKSRPEPPQHVGASDSTGAATTKEVGQASNSMGATAVAPGFALQEQRPGSRSPATGSPPKGQQHPQQHQHQFDDQRRQQQHQALKAPDAPTSFQDPQPHGRLPEAPGDDLNAVGGQQAQARPQWQRSGESGSHHRQAITYPVPSLAAPMPSNWAQPLVRPQSMVLGPEAAAIQRRGLNWVAAAVAGTDATMDAAGQLPGGTRVGGAAVAASATAGADAIVVGFDGRRACQVRQQRPLQQQQGKPQSSPPAQQQQQLLPCVWTQATQQGGKGVQPSRLPSQQQQHRAQTLGQSSSPGRGAGRRSSQGRVGNNISDSGSLIDRAGRGHGRGTALSPSARGPSQLAPVPAAPTVAPAMARDACCPICGVPFPARMKNSEVNAHLDACVNSIPTL
ncbi:hypothetical protein Vretimale_8347 [Volvox reticuliferus]|uniref:Uncharacterized protein n=1 Tax=Volvox reticuliferus TaxID=1737510 RepID=A0A8J4GAP6_9CHLO|nr:hypothetical protein Vretifemale_11719 [Volvox reticuliferus]GIM03624.1 hypothetical protein Vretimale_8347 [Volvox reticuliferus]